MILQPNNPTHPILHRAPGQPALPPESNKSLCSWEFRLAAVPIFNAKKTPTKNSSANTHSAKTCTFASTLSTNVSACGVRCSPTIERRKNHNKETWFMKIHRQELIFHCFASNLLLSPLLHDALFASSKPSSSHRTGRTGRRSRGDWGSAPHYQTEETRLMMD